MVGEGQPCMRRMVDFFYFVCFHEEFVCINNPSGAAEAFRCHYYVHYGISFAVFSHQERQLFGVSS